MKYVPELLYWIGERENIRIKKESGRQYLRLTNDPIMETGRWCNVRREDDKVTRWIFDNFMPTDRSDPTIPFAMCLARLVNWPDTLRELGYPADGWTAPYRAAFLDVFAARRANKLKAWTGAYMVTGGFSAGGEPKEVIIARVLDGAWVTAHDLIGLDNAPTLSRTADILSCPGMGTFLVAQVIADLKNTDHLKSAPDRMTWCAPGPGSTMGLNFIHDRPRTKSIGGEQFIAEVNQIRQLLADRLDLHICAQNTQNCLCELSKYIRVRYFGERMKNTYRPS